MGLKAFYNNNKVEFFTGAGIGAVLTGVFVACRNTLKLNRIFEEHNTAREIIHERKEEGYDTATDTMKLYGYTALRVFSLYLAPGALIVGGCAAFMHATKLTMDENIKLAEKNAALAALASGTEERFDKYRERIVEKYGKEVDEQIMSPEEEVEEEVEETDGNGKKRKTKHTNHVINPDEDLDVCHFYITRANPNYNDDEKLMDYLFSCVEDAVNRDLNTRREDARPTWVTVNDIRERFAVDPKRELQCWGYVKDTFDPNDSEMIVIKGIKKKIPGADGELVDAYQVNIFGARNIADEMW